MGKVYVLHLTPSSSEEQRAAAVQRLGEQIWIFISTLGQGHWLDINLWVFSFSFCWSLEKLERWLEAHADTGRTCELHTASFSPGTEPRSLRGNRTAPMWGTPIVHFYSARQPKYPSCQRASLTLCGTTLPTLFRFHGASLILKICILRKGKPAPIVTQMVKYLDASAAGACAYTYLILHGKRWQTVARVYASS